MRTDIRAASLAATFAVSLAAVLLIAGSAAAQQDPHSGPAAPPADLQQLTPEQRRDALEAYAHIVCKCPVENWSKTLASCPDGCADQQKGMVLRRIAEGWKLDAIVAEQVERFGSKAAADPGAGKDGSLWIMLSLAIGAVAAVGVLLSWRRRAGVTAATQQPARAATGDETSAIERELREID